jgi:hypothetical protein
MRPHSQVLGIRTPTSFGETQFNSLEGIRYKHAWMFWMLRAFIYLVPVLIPLQNFRGKDWKALSRVRKGNWAPGLPCFWSHGRSKWSENKVPESWLATPGSSEIQAFLGGRKDPQTLRWRMAHRDFIGVWCQEIDLQGNEEGRTGGEKLTHKGIATEAADTLQGAWSRGHPLELSFASYPRSLGGGITSGGVYPQKGCSCK